MAAAVGQLPVLPPKRGRLPAQKRRRSSKHNKLVAGRPLGAITARRLLDSIPDADFKRALSYSGEEKLVRLLSLLYDPAHAKLTLWDLCKEAGVGVGDLHAMWRKYHVNVGMAKMAMHAPQVLDDIGEDAKTTVHVCLKCNGRGEVLQVRVDEDGKVMLREDGKEDKKVAVCSSCFGKGKIRVPGDKTSRELVMQAMGLVGKGGPMVAIQQNFDGNGAGVPSFESTMRLVGQGQTPIQKEGGE